MNRFRPIFLTTVTTFVGLIPIMAERSTTAEFLKPAVLSLSFGVLFALFVSLLMVPALYMIGWDYQQFVRRLRGKPTDGQPVSRAPGCFRGGVASGCGNPAVNPKPLWVESADCPMGCR